MDYKTIFQANRDSSRRLHRIIEDINDTDMSIKVGSEWNLSLTLAHLAFWDQRAIFVIESSIKNKKLHAPLYDAQLNDILTSIFELIPPKEIKRYAATVSDKLDTALENCPNDLLNEIGKANFRLIEISIHRNPHLDDIENALKMRK